MDPVDRPLIVKNLEYYKDPKTHRIVKERIKERLTALNSSKIPSSVTFATLCMGLPLAASTAGLLLNLQGVETTAAFFARTSIRLLQLNVSFMGGLHYGFAASNYEVAIS